MAVKILLEGLTAFLVSRHTAANSAQACTCGQGLGVSQSRGGVSQHGLAAPKGASALARPCTDKKTSSWASLRLCFLPWAPV